MLGNQFQEAFLWTTSLHQNQTRKSSNTPYLAHLMGVAALVIENGGTEEVAIAALLHDSIEDRGATIEEIEKKFGRKVAKLVDTVTESYTKPKPQWIERKKLYLSKLRNGSPEAILISLADKLHNVRSLEEGLYIHGENLWQKFFKSRKEETFWFYRELMEIYRDRGFEKNWLFIELQRILKRIF